MRRTERIIASGTSKRQKKPQTGVSTFKAWCTEKKIQTPLEEMSIGQLEQNLRRFCAEARAKKGEDYSKSTLLGFRHSMERYLNVPPLKEA
ncbi:hypothetical protein AWC38_SpisGene8547 [Stylophora pistillata]|uniref:Core-binding (CB) domain-containing protein n=1 Tax=Stylophora pistillata TaxID=50429 RepID=A0A2B4SCH7_STYPI|nr:hypothetical protein AWC38_SpisGene8547 [Stylophora pistillata]